MESTDLNTPPSDDARFDAWLRTNASLAPLPDGEFSARVLRNLPGPALDPRLLEEMERAQRAEARRRGLFCAAGAAAGVAVFLANAGSGAGPAEFWHALGDVRFGLPETLSAMGTAAIIGGALVLVYWKQLKALQRRFA